MACLKYFEDADKRTESVSRRKRLTPAQKKALGEYNFRLAREDNYLGSVFVNRQGIAEYASKRREAYEACKALGLGAEHGL